MKEGEITVLSLLAIVIGLLATGDQDVFLGCLFGVLTGLVPGLHVNTFLPFLDGAVAFVLGVAISHSFFDFIPAILVGAPDEGAALSVLPTHKMLLQGKALEAFRITVASGLVSGLIAIAMIPLLSSFMHLQWMVPIVLIVSLFVLVNSTKQKLATLVVIILSAAIGFLAFETAQGIPAILSGFFGVSTIIYSIIGRDCIPQQRAHAEVRISFKETLLGAIAGSIAGLFPAISSSVAATMVSPRMRKKDFLAILGGTNTVYVLVAVLAIHLIGRPRSGAGIAIAESSTSLIQLAGLSLIALGFSALLAWHLSKSIITNFNKLDYKKLSFIALFIVVVLNLLSGWDSFVLMLGASVVGLIALRFRARRSACMASLIIPVLIIYLA